MLNKLDLVRRIEGEIEKEILSAPSIDSPPTELTKLLLYLDLLDESEAAAIVRRIAHLVSTSSLWDTGLVEVLAVFNYNED
jgi:hypothetical protein